MKFKFLEHTADVKFQAYGSSIEKAFENSALALKEVMFGKIKVKSKIKKKIKIEGKDNSGLLYRFLEQFLYLLDAENFIFEKVKVKIQKIDNPLADQKSKVNKIFDIKDKMLEAEVLGDVASNYKFTNDVKAITYNQMFVRKEKGKFICQVVLDV